MIATTSTGIRIENENQWPLGYVVLRVLRMLISALLLSALLIGWRTFGPLELGGSSTYVMVSGTSMLPLFRPGDAVILRTESSYHVGEVIAYYNPQLGIKVMHRIYAVQDGHFLMKGDNNNFIDPYHPTISNVVGAEWLHVQGAGWVLFYLRQPPMAGLMAGVVGVLAFTGRKQLKRRRYRIETQ